MKRRIIYLLALLVIFIFSCKKKSDEQASQPVSPAPDYIQLSVGNYWVYEFYKVDTNGVEQKLTHTDSSYILKDTIINRNKYFVRLSNPIQFTRSGSLLTGPDTSYMRDSLGYLLVLDYYGNTHVGFSRDNFSYVFEADTNFNLLWSQQKMAGRDSIVSVPAGTFKTRSVCLFVYPLQPTYPLGIRKYFTIYGEGVGEIKHTYGFYDSPDHYEARLVRYHVMNK